MSRPRIISVAYNPTDNEQIIETNIEICDNIMNDLLHMRNANKQFSLIVNNVMVLENVDRYAIIEELLNIQAHLICQLIIFEQ